MKIILTLFFLLTAIPHSYSQRVTHPANSSDTIDIKGFVYTRAGSPIISTSVVLCKPDSSIITATITDSLGRYQFKKLLAQSYILIFRHISYEDKYLFLSRIQPEKYIEPTVVRLEEKAIQLQDVLVTGKPPAAIEKTQGGFTFNLDERLNKSTLWEVLKQTPFVDADDDGGLGIMGKKGSVVYINGRRVHLGGNALLQMLKNQSAENVKSIEILSNPPSNYDAQGNAGVINILLKKPAEEGFFGSISISGEQAKFSNQRANANFNFAKGKITSQLGLRGATNKNRIIEDSDIYLETIEQHNHSVLVRKERSLPIGANLSTDVTINKKHTLSIQSSFSHSSQNRLWQTKNDFSGIPPATIDSTNLTTSNQDTYNTFYDVDISDKLEIDTLGGNVSFAGSFFRQNNGAKAPYESVGTFSSSNFQTKSTQRLTNYAVKADLQKKVFSRATFRFGLKANTSESLAGNRFFVMRNSGYVNDVAKENDFRYKEQILASYISLQHDLNERLHGTLGFRIENTKIDGHEKTRDSVLTRNFLNLFPNLSLTYDITSTDRLAVDFGSRIMRPGFWELNPTPLFISPVMYSEGNAFLLPAQATNLQLSYLLKEKFVFVAVHSFIKRDFMQFQLSHPGSDTVVYTRYNYGNNRTFSLNGNYTDSYFGKKLKVNLNIGANFSRFSGALADRTIALKSWQAQSRARIDYGFGKKSKNGIYIAHYYYSPFSSAQGRDFSLQYSEVGFNTKYRDLSIQLRYVDPFNSGINKFTSVTPSILSSYTSIDGSRSRVIATLSYRFGNNSTRRAKNIESANDEQKNRKTF